MGGFQVPSQSFSCYQALDWLCSASATLLNQINASRRVREMLENGKADDLVKLGIVSRLAELLERTYDVDLQSEVIWSLANIAAGKSPHTKLVLRKCLSKFIELLDENCIDEIKNDIIWAFSNIAGDSRDCRDELIKAGVLDRIVHLLNSSQSQNIEKNSIWFLSNVFRHCKVPVSIAIAQPCLPILVRYLKHTNIEILCNACWSLKYLASGTTMQVNALIETGMCPSLIALFKCQPVVNCALLVAINILSGTNRQTDALISCGVIPAFMKLLQQNSDPNVVKNVCFAFSNIAASGTKHIEALLAADVYAKLLEIYDSGCPPSIQAEIMHVFSNTLCNHHFNDDFGEKLGTSYLHILVDSLSSSDDHAGAALHALICFFKCYKFIPANAYIPILNLTGHSNAEIARFANGLITALKLANQSSAH